MKIAILGTGFGGMAAAYDWLTEEGRLKSNNWHTEGESHGF